MTTPELKPATDWASEFNRIDVDISVAEIQAIQANATAVARHQALTEAADRLIQRLVDNDCCVEAIKEAEADLIALRDTKPISNMSDARSRTTK